MQRTIWRFGKTKRGVRRYQCSTCGQPCTETPGTICFRRRIPDHELFATLAFLAAGRWSSSLASANGVKEEPLLAGLSAAVQHAEQVEDVRMAAFKIQRGQVDAL